MWIQFKPTLKPMIGLQDFSLFLILLLVICFWLRPESFTHPFRSLYEKRREKRNFLRNLPLCELVDFKEVIGFHVDPVTREKKSTTWGIIHYSRNGGYHVIPAMPDHNPKRIIDNVYLRLSAQRALLAAVTPNLRAVRVSINQEDRVVSLYFFYDKKIENRIFDLATTAISEISSDIFPDYRIVEHIERIDASRRIPEVVNSDTVYSRYKK